MLETVSVALVPEKLQRLNSYIQKLLTCSNEDFQQVITHLSGYRRQFDELKQLSGELCQTQASPALQQRRQVSKQVSLCLEEIDHLVTHLQYQDIIRQKLEHMGQVHRLLSDQQQYTFLKQVLLLHIDLLQLASREYRHATGQTVECLSAINQETSLISIYCLQSSNASHRAESEVYRQLVGNIARASELFTRLAGPVTDQQQPAGNLQQKLAGLTGKIDRARTIKTRIGEAIASLASQGLSEELAGRLQTLTEEFEQLGSSILESFSENFSQAASDILLEAGKELPGGTQEVLQQLQGFNQKIYNTLHQASEVSRKLSDSLHMTIRQIRKTSLFESTVASMVEEMYFFLAGLQETPTGHSAETQRLLGEIAGCYTMESERVAFVRVFGELPESQQPADNSPADEQDVELF